MEEREIIYIDQTSFSIWSRKKQTWQYGHSKIDFIQADNKSENFTLYGGISEKKGDLTYMVSNSTNTGNFMDFLNVLEE